MPARERTKKTKNTTTGKSAIKAPRQPASKTKRDRAPQRKPVPQTAKSATPKPQQTKNVAKRRKPEEVDRSRPADQMTAVEIARVLQEIAALLELTGENVFKVRAYENAARILPGVGEALQRLIEEGELPDVPGIGTGIADRIEILARTGKLPYHEELKTRVPPGLVEMLHVPGLGPKKIKLLYDTLDISSIEELERACNEHRLSELRGFGEKSQQNMLTAIQQYRRVHTRFLWPIAAAHAMPVFEALSGHRDVLRAAIAGSIRRKRETVKDVDLLVSTENGETVSRFFIKGPWTERVLGSGTTKTSIVHTSGLQMDLRVVTDREFPHALHHFTGSKAHNVAMRSRAQRLGFKINEYGLFHGEELVPCRDEAEIFHALGLDYIPPELREDLGEIAAAETHTLPERLIELDDLRGAFHVHSNDGLGGAPLRDMVAASAALRWDYVGISNAGMTPDQARTHLATLRRLADQTHARPHVFCGIVASIQLAGDLDLPDELLQRFDFVIAALSSDFDLDRDTQTRRLLRALENPRVTILAHPMGRLLEPPRGLEIDLPAVMEMAAARHVLLELNGDPRRMDLDGPMTKLGRDHGAQFCINPDARVPADLRNIEYGVAMARRGWLESRHVVNTLSVAKVQEYFQRAAGKK